MEEMSNFYFTPACPACPGGYSLEQEIFVERMLTHKVVFAAEIYKETNQAKERIHAFEERNKKLLAQSSQIKATQEVLSKTFDKTKKALNANQRKMKELRKEIDEIGKSAQALNNLLASYERKRKASQGADGKNKKYEGPKINLPEHSLPWPVKGKIISSFGKEYRADLNTYIFRDGIKIAAAYGTTVRAVMEGSVIYAGPFRSYGNVVIVDHGKGIFTIYGFLKEIQAPVGTKLMAQGALGTAGKDTQSSSGTGQSAVYFEIRQGTTAVDPEQWLK
jgi:septal ring factor EnvC (AmiA/AmiB activator)